MTTRDELLAELRADGIADPEVLRAMEAVPRDRFVPEEERHLAWGNFPLPIGEGQTISQPYIVAWMVEAARLSRGSRVLDVGAGSGYQSAVLAEVLGLGPGADPGAPHGRLHAVEILPELAERARRTLEALGVRGVEIACRDGSLGWPEHAPFDAILVAAAPLVVPPPLLEQLAPGGRLVIPLGHPHDTQELQVIVRTPSGPRVERSLPVRFVPMVGAAAR